MSDSASWYSEPSSVLAELQMERKERAGCPSITGYRDIQELRRGGQGIVYSATQLSTSRRVAIKVLREGIYASGTQRFRFEREIELVAGLRHPNIVNIHDSGVTADGRLFYVMELVEGETLSFYLNSDIAWSGVAHGDTDEPQAQRGAKSNRGTTLPAARARAGRSHHHVEMRSEKNRLRLFISICDAINYAHRKGVIHRDLKPGNILVDAEGTPRVLDFGLAKIADEAAVGEELGAMSVTGQFMGSLPWASPEQVRGDHTAVDVRTDVYSLGVILCQMMIGRFPYSVNGNIQEITDNILHADPAMPAQKQQKLDEDLAIIIRTCLAKEPERRYQSAGDIAGDVRRYMAGEPLLARAPSAAYQLSKYAQRHRALMGGLLAALVLLVLGISGTTYGLFKARAERNWAIEAERRAETERDRSAAISRFLNGMLSSVDPRKAGYRVTVAQVLDKAAGDVDVQFADQPIIRASLYQTIGESYVNLGLSDAGAPLITAALEIRRRVLGDSHPDTLISMETARLAPAERETLLRHVIAVRTATLGADHPLTLRAMTTLAENTYAFQCRLPEAKRLLRRSYDLCRKALGEEHPETLRAMNHLGRVLHFLGPLDESEQLLRKMLQICRRSPDPDYRWTLAAKIDLARLLSTRGKLAEAEPFLRDVIDVQKRVLGEYHPNTLMTTDFLVEVLIGQGRLEEAEDLALITAGRKNRDQSIPMEHFSPHGLVLVRQAQGRLEEAESLQQKVIALVRKRLGPSHPFVFNERNRLGVIWMRQGKWQDAAALLGELMASAPRNLETAWMTWELQANYGYALGMAGQRSQALTLLTEAQTELSKLLGPDNKRTKRATSYLEEIGRLPQSVSRHSSGPEDEG